LIVKNVIGLAALLALSSPNVGAAEGDFDQGFGNAGITYIRANDAIARTMRPVAAIELPDGKLLFAGVREKLFGGRSSLRT